MSENIELTHSTTLQNEQMTQPNSSEQTSPLDAGDQQTLIHSRILIIDSESLVADGLKDYLQASGFNNVAAVCSDEAIQDVLINEKADVVLLDRMAANGLDILSAMRVDKAYKHTPVIVLTTVIDSATKLKALELGATEFLTKPVNINELALRLRNILRDKFYHDCLAFVDPVTGLPNRERHLHVLDSALRFAKRYGVIGAELHINIARFQQISDALGTTVSDELLREVAKRLQTCIRDTDSIAVDEGHGTSKILSRPGEMISISCCRSSPVRIAQGTWHNGLSTRLRRLLSLMNTNCTWAAMSAFPCSPMMARSPVISLNMPVLPCTTPSRPAKINTSFIPRN